MQKLNSSARTAAKIKFKSWGLTTSAKIETILLLAAGLLSSCNVENDSTAYLQNMERPVICIAKKDSVSAIFKGHDGRLFVAKIENWNGSALINSYNVGDTLR